MTHKPLWPFSKTELAPICDEPDLIPTQFKQLPISPLTGYMDNRTARIAFDSAAQPDNSANSEFAPAQVLYELAAADMLQIHDAPHYRYNPDAQPYAVISARLYMRNPLPDHQWIRAWHILETAAKAVVAGQFLTLRQWVQHHDILSTIPRGSTTDPTTHQTYRIIRDWVCQFSSIPNPDPYSPLDAAIYARSSFRTALTSHQNTSVRNIAAWGAIHHLAMARHQDYNPPTAIDHLDKTDRLMGDIYAANAITWLRPAITKLSPPLETP